MISLLISTHSAAQEIGETELNKILDTYIAKYDRIVTTRESTLHWHKFVSVFVSNSGEAYRRNVKRVEAEREGDTVDAYELYDPGTVVIKEHHDAIDGGVVGWFLMIREPSVTPSIVGGPWRYVELDKERKIKLDGRGTNALVANRCATCHQETSVRDYIFHTFSDDTKESVNKKP